MYAQIFHGTNAKELKEFFLLKRRFNKLASDEKEQVSKKGFAFLARENKKNLEEFILVSFCGEDILAMEMQGEKTFVFSLSRALILKSSLMKSQKGFPPDYECSFSGIKLTDIRLSVKSKEEKIFGNFFAKE